MQKGTWLRFNNRNVFETLLRKAVVHPTIIYNATLSSIFLDY